MHILLSAFACAPSGGSEGGVGWRYAIELSKNHRVVVVTDTTRRAAIEAALLNVDISNLKFVYYRPCWLKQIPLNSYTAKLLFTAWQFSLLSFARKLSGVHHFDVAWHLTYGVYRTPSFLGYMGLPFVFGPVGGGEDAPLRLKKSIHGREKIKELVRSLMNNLASYNPLLFLALRKADLILVRTVETKKALPWTVRSSAIIKQEIGVEPQYLSECVQRSQERPIRLLFAGRFEGWKGVHLAIRAVGVAYKRGVNVQFTLVGAGPFESSLKSLAVEQGIAANVAWLGRIPQVELFKIYKQHDIFLFPSLHDSGGNVVLEAQSFGLPVICLDLGGPATLVDASSAVIINTELKTEEQVISALADEIQFLATNEDVRFKLAEGALKNSANQTWAGRIADIVNMIEERIYKH